MIYKSTVIGDMMNQLQRVEGWSICSSPASCFVGPDTPVQSTNLFSYLLFKVQMDDFVGPDLADERKGTKNRKVYSVGEKHMVPILDARR